MRACILGLRQSARFSYKLDMYATNSAFSASNSSFAVFRLLLYQNKTETCITNSPTNLTLLISLFTTNLTLLISLFTINLTLLILLFTINLSLLILLFTTNLTLSSRYLLLTSLSLIMLLTTNISLLILLFTIYLSFLILLFTINLFLLFLLFTINLLTNEIRRVRTNSK